MFEEFEVHPKWSFHNKSRWGFFSVTKKKNIVVNIDGEEYSFLMNYVIPKGLYTPSKELSVEVFKGSVLLSRVITNQNPGYIEFKGARSNLLIDDKGYVKGVCGQSGGGFKMKLKFEWRTGIAQIIFVVGSHALAEAELNYGKKYPEYKVVSSGYIDKEVIAVLLIVIELQHSVCAGL